MADTIIVIMLCLVVVGVWKTHNKVGLIMRHLDIKLPEEE